MSDSCRTYEQTLYDYLDENATAAGVLETIRTTGDSETGDRGTAQTGTGRLYCTSSSKKNKLQQEVPPMAGSTKEIKLRIRSVESTRQITQGHGAGGVHASCAAPKTACRGQPPLFRDAIRDAVRHRWGRIPRLTVPYLARRETNRRLYIVIAGDRGSGGRLQRTTSSRLVRSRRCGQRLPRACPSARRPLSISERRKANVLTTGLCRGGAISSVSDCFEHFHALSARRFLAGEFDEIRLGLYAICLGCSTQTAAVLPRAASRRSRRARAGP